MVYYHSKILKFRSKCHGHPYCRKPDTLYTCKMDGVDRTPCWTEIVNRLITQSVYNLRGRTLFGVWYTMLDR